MKHKTTKYSWGVTSGECASAGRAYCHQPQNKNFYSVLAADPWAIGRWGVTVHHSVTGDFNQNAPSILRQEHYDLMCLVTLLLDCQVSGILTLRSANNRSSSSEYLLAQRRVSTKAHALSWPTTYKLSQHAIALQKLSLLLRVRVVVVGSHR